MLETVTVVRVCKVRIPWSRNKQSRTYVNTLLKESLLNVN